MYVQRKSVLCLRPARSRNHCFSGIPTMYFTAHYLINGTIQYIISYKILEPITLCNAGILYNSITEIPNSPTSFHERLQCQILRKIYNS